MCIICGYADAEELSDVLNQLISGAGSSSSSSSASGSSRRGSSLSSSRNSSSRNNNRRNTTNNRTTSRNNRTLSSRNRSNVPSGRVNFEGEVSIASDASTNTLIINASRGDYMRLKTVIDRLDVKRKQVLVEATILEVSLTDGESTGVQLLGSTGTDSAGIFAQSDSGAANAGPDLISILTNPSSLSGLTLAAASEGTLTLPGGITLPSQTAMLSAVKSLQNVNVLSSPTILTTDNEEAEIIVGQNVPFVTSTSTDSSNISNTFNSIERQDVGITLRITPQVSTGNFVNLEIFVEISAVIDGTDADENGPTTTIRTIETNVDVKNGQMIVTGGLITDNLTESASGVPFLMDIPVLGRLFRTSASDQEKEKLGYFYYSSGNRGSV